VELGGGTEGRAAQEPATYAINGKTRDPAGYTAPSSIYKSDRAGRAIKRAFVIGTCNRGKRDL